MSNFSPIAAAVPAALAPTLERAKVATIDRGYRQAGDVIERTKMVREVMEAVMKEGTHFGTIPGTQKPTLYQPGCDVLAVTFRIATKVALVEDLSTADTVRYRITVAGMHQVTGELLAEGIGECSSDEEKYRWRRPVCDEEFHDTAVDRRREKWAKGQGGKAYKNKQIRTSPPDVANTVLKMATKRAKVAMILNATAASDVFAQDLEDLSEELREHLSEEGGQQISMPRATGQAPSGAPATSQPESVARPPAPAAAPVAPLPAMVTAPAGQPPVPTTLGTVYRRDAVRVIDMEPRMTKPKVNAKTGEETPGNPYAIVTLSTGEKFQSFHRNLNASLESWWAAKTAIDVDCKTSTKGLEYMPVIEKAAAVMS